jgi:hypothetical protein
VWRKWFLGEVDAPAMRVEWERAAPDAVWTLADALYTFETSRPVNTLSAHPFDLIGDERRTVQDGTEDPTDREVCSCSGEMLSRGSYHQLSLPKIKFITPRQSAAYGKCIFADYNNVRKDKCLTEFLRFKDCYTVRMGLCVDLENDN